MLIAQINKIGIKVARSVLDYCTGSKCIKLENDRVVLKYFAKNYINSMFFTFPLQYVTTHLILFALLHVVDAVFHFPTLLH